MAKKKEAEMSTVDEVVEDLLGELNKHATSSKAYMQGDHANHTWGIEIPFVAMQWLVGGSSVLPAQRYIGVSGQRKSYKSTMMVELGNWFIQNNGVHIYLDTENKTSPSMLDAMTWWNGIQTLNRRLYKVCGSITEWQTLVTRSVENARATGIRPKGSRVPIYACVDSLMGRSTEEADRELRKEGAAKERGFPVSSLQITNYLEALNLLGTTMSVGWVQHMKESMEQTSYGGKQYKEKGPQASQFSCSVHLRVNKGSPIREADRDGAPFPGVTVEGYELWVKTEMSCLGPDKRVLPVDLCWQYVDCTDDEGKTYRRQVMWFDWHAALGKLLVRMKYDEKMLYAKERGALAETIHFVEAKKNSIKCEALGLDGASYHAFGKAIDDNIEMRDQLSRFLGITEFQTIQDADIDFEAGRLAAKKTKGR